MKRLLAALCAWLALVCGEPARAAPSVILSAFGTGAAAGANTTWNWSGSCAVNQVVVVFMASSSGSVTPNSMSDTKGNTWTGGSGAGVSGGVRTRIFTSKLASAITASDQFTVVFSGGSQVGVAVAACIDDTSAVVAGEAIAQATSTAPGVTTGTLTNLPNYVLIGFFNASNAPTQTSGFTPFSNAVSTNFGWFTYIKSTTNSTESFSATKTSSSWVVQSQAVEYAAPPVICPKTRTLLGVGC